MSDNTQDAVTLETFVVGEILNLLPVLFLLVAGFFLLEAGSVRSKNATAILMKNILNVSVGITGFWLIGGGIAYGSGPVFGTDGEFYALSAGFNLGAVNLTTWMVGALFALTASSIVSGAVAERSSTESYMWWCLWSSILFYPLIVHWVWNSEGWLAEFGFVDIAGSGVVHSYGAFCAVAAVWMIGPRSERLDATGRWIDDPKSLVGHSSLMQSLGTVLLVAGFYAFNGTSVLTISFDEPDVVQYYALTLVNTALGAMGGGLTAVLMSRFTGKKVYELTHVNMGVINGSIAVCAGCFYYQPWSAYLLGVIATLVYFAVRKLMNKLQLDDPLDAVAVHGGSGFVGVFGLAIFASDPNNEVVGVIHGEFDLLYKQLVGYLVIAAVGLISTVIVLLPLSLAGYTRVSQEIEADGIDISIGQPAYPEVASKGDFIKFREFLTSQNVYSDFEEHRTAFQAWLSKEQRGTVGIAGNIPGASNIPPQGQQNASTSQTQDLSDKKHEAINVPAGNGVTDVGDEAQDSDPSTGLGTSNKQRQSVRSETSTTQAPPKVINTNKRRESMRHPSTSGAVTGANLGTSSVEGMTPSPQSSRAGTYLSRVDPSSQF
ncbi:hypothetical protein SARC_10226 [Sphaeroforma arctica JP610]|uniref:Ammonium transporter AmtB-like domain-containing protein n=1 Tax=Sphaeroforma arctica JP610 TaxID=667725 RepID=A0A0L0FMQ3_9EUKA|nr:hypothetical protein SARC_10226 [Sphaeroforma arctica JP610]KNC77313.1 hypothetical protein SARC_10226 [Sphaeroforma arctica JP610]|eukprot:XP_014151215.1 hypothetical protein SARC_10226 [Sphaeroforma arctica JP610]